MDSKPRATYGAHAWLARSPAKQEGCDGGISPSLTQSTTCRDHAVRGVGDLRYVVPRTPEAQLLHATAQRVGVQAQDPRRAFWSPDHARGLVQHREDMVPFDLFER